MPNLVHIFERKTGKPHRCYPVDAVECLKVKESNAEGAPSMYVATEAECEAPKPAGKAEAPKPAGKK